MWDPHRSGLEPVSRALAGNSNPLDYQEDYTLYFLEDLLKHTDSFLFSCGFLVASCRLCYLHIFRKSHWPALLISLALSPCPGHICLSWSWRHMWCSPHISDECKEGVRVFREHPSFLLCRTKYLPSHLNQKYMWWVRGFLLCPPFYGMWRWWPHFMFLKMLLIKHKESKFPLLLMFYWLFSGFVDSSVCIIFLTNVLRIENNHIISFLKRYSREFSRLKCGIYFS